MTQQDLDRLITKTDVNPIAKKGLKTIRRAMMSGSVGEPNVNSATWSVEIQADGDFPVRMTFSFKRDWYGGKKVS